MAATLFNNDGKAISSGGAESQTKTSPKNSSKIEAEFVKCECCGLTEECTPAYILRVQERHQGRWICGLCSEAIKDEISRSKRLISVEEALNRHLEFCQQFRSSSPPRNPTEELIAAVKQLLFRSLDSPRAMMKGGSSICGSTTSSSSLVRSTSSCSAIDD